MGLKRRALLVAGAADTFLRELTKKSSASHPLGLLSIASILKLHGWEVRVLDLLIGVTRETLRREIAEWKPAFLGIGCSTAEFGGSLEVAREAREGAPGLPVIMGGPHVSFLPEETLRSGYVDYVVMREGESTIIELLGAMDGFWPVSRVRGVAYLRDGELMISPPRSYLTQLDQLPLAPFSLVSPDGYLARTTIVSSRGCPGGCIFCASGALSGRHYRMRSPESVWSEVYYRYRKSGDNYFVLFDDTFTSDPSRVGRFCDLILASRCKLQWRCNSRVDQATPDVLGRLAAAGCLAVHYGIESGDQHILDSISKGVTLDQIEQAVSGAAAHGMTAMCSFIIGHPEDTEESVKKTFALARRLREKYQAYVTLSCMVPFPGTALWKHADRLGVSIKADMWSAYDINNVVISTRHLSHERLRELSFDAMAMIQSDG